MHPQHKCHTTVHVRNKSHQTCNKPLELVPNYEFTYSSVDAAHLTEAEKDALRQKALNAGLSDDEIKGLVFSGSLTSVTWKQTTTKIKTDDSAKDTEVKENTDNQIVENTDEKGAITYDITVNGKTYKGLTKSEDGTYTKTDKTSNTTTVITVLTPIWISRRKPMPIRSKRCCASSIAQICRRTVISLLTLTALPAGKRMTTPRSRSTILVC